jgi:hypothetical protein
MSTISSGTTLTTALVQTGDTTGDLVIKTGASNTTAVTINTAGAIGVGPTPSYGSAGQYLQSAGNAAPATWATIPATNPGGATTQVQFNNAGVFAGSANLTFNGTTLTSAALTSTGVATFSAGSAAAPAITTAGDTNTGIFFPAADTIAFTEGGAEVARFNSSGFLGIGNSATSPSGLLTLRDTNDIAFNISKAGVGSFDITNAGTSGVTLGTQDPYILAFKTNNTERGRFDTSGNFLFNSGYGSVAVAYGCRAWVNFNGSGGGIRSSGNVTSVAVNGVGRYTVNMTTALPDANYSRVVTASGLSGDGNGVCANTDVVSGNSVTATSSAFFILLTISGQSGYRDSPFVSAAVFR